MSCQLSDNYTHCTLRWEATDDDDGEWSDEVVEMMMMIV